MTDTSVKHPVFDWQDVETVMLDMDGTLLDLRFDTWFWSELVPMHYGIRHGIDRDEVLRRLMPEFESRRGTLEWYCLDFWTKTLDLDLQGLKHNVAHEIRFLPGVPKFLTRMRQEGRRLVLVTNSHLDILSLKLACTGLGSYFKAIYSSHEFGVPKEAGDFWQRLNEVEKFDRQSSMFVDDSLPVLSAARDYGIRHVIGIMKPDSEQPARPLADFPAVHSLVDLIA